MNLILRVLEKGFEPTKDCSKVIVEISTFKIVLFINSDLNSIRHGDSYKEKKFVDFFTFY